MMAKSTVTDLEVKLSELERAMNAAETNLVELDDSWNAQSSASPPCTGSSAARLDEIHRHSSLLWERWMALQNVVRRARDLIETAEPDRRELAELIEGDSVVVSSATLPLARRTLTGAFRDQATFRPSALLDEMGTDFLAARDALAALADARRGIDERLAQLRVEVRQLLDGQAGEIPAPDQAAQLAAAVAEVGRWQTDPLAAQSSLEALAGLTARLRSELADLHLRRGGLAENLAAAARSLVDAQRRWRSLQDTASKIRAAFTTTPDGLDASVAAADKALRLLSGRLAELGARTELQWRATADDLIRWHNELERLTAAADALASASIAPLARRAELRGLLDASQAKARSEGLGESAELQERADRALGSLRQVPCDLAGAEQLIEDYLAAVRSRAEGVR